MDENKNDFIPITSVVDEFQSDNELIEFAKKNPLQIIAHNLFCISEQLNVITEMIIEQRKETIDKKKPILQAPKSRKFIYDKNK